MKLPRLSHRTLGALIAVAGALPAALPAILPAPYVMPALSLLSIIGAALTGYSQSPLPQIKPPLRDTKKKIPSLPK